MKKCICWCLSISGLRVFENRLIFRPTTGREHQEDREMCIIIENVRCISRHIPINMVTKSRILKLHGHEPRMAAIKLHMPYINLWAEPEGKNRLWRNKPVWEDKIKWISKKLFRWYGMVSYFTGYGEWQTFTNTLLKLTGP